MQNGKGRRRMRNVLTRAQTGGEVPMMITAATTTTAMKTMMTLRVIATVAPTSLQGRHCVALAMSQANWILIKPGKPMPMVGAKRAAEGMAGIELITKYYRCVTNRRIRARD